MVAPYILTPYRCFFRLAPDAGFDAMPPDGDEPKPPLMLLVGKMHLIGLQPLCKMGRS